MPHRFYILNGIRIVLLVAFLTIDSSALRLTLLVALAATLVFDIVAYREDKRREAEENPDADAHLHVPMPPEHVLRQRR